MGSAAADGDDTMKRPGGRGEERILVSVRVRPLNQKETSRSEIVDWECINDTTIIYNNHFSPERSMYPASYAFDRVFRCNCSTRQVYEEGAKAVVLSAVRGINSSVFAYGQTSSGKTFTMSGITEYTMEDIFDYIQKHKERQFLLKFSAMEIYNESVRDLLTADDSPLRLLDDPERGTVVEKLTEEILRDRNHFKELLSVCEAQRKIGETFLNEVSSRSHQILRLTIESSNREFLGKNNSGSLAATLNFVDLAGSERASQALSAGSRLKEGSHINRSLLTLGTVIRKLSQGRTGHIPFRDSKLTRILQSSLGGNARAAIICTMSPARSYSEQSRNTLLFASCAKEITTSARVNVVISDKALVKHLQRELARLEDELRSSCPSLQAEASDVLREKDYKIEELEKQVSQLTQQLNLALSQIHDLHQRIGDRSPTTWEREDSFYTRFYGRQVSEGSISNATTATDHQSFIRGSHASETGHHSPDRHSTVSYDENYSISDFEENIPPSSPFERIFPETPGDVSPPMGTQNPNLVFQAPTGYIEQKTNLSEINSCIVSEEICEETPSSYEVVSCQVSEEITGRTPETFEIHLQQVSDRRSPCVAEFDPYHVLDQIAEQAPQSDQHHHYQASQESAEKTHNDDDIDPYYIPEEIIGEHTEEHLEHCCKEVECVESPKTDNLQTDSFLPVEGEPLLLISCESDKLKDDNLSEETASSNRQPSLQDIKEQSGKQKIVDMLDCKKFNYVANRNCQSNNTSFRSSTSLEKVNYEMKTKNGDGGDNFTAAFEEIQTQSSLEHDVDSEVIQKSRGDITADEILVTDSKAPNHIKKAGSFTFDTETKAIAEPQCLQQLANYQMEDTMHKQSKSTKNTKDVGLNPQDDSDNSPSWMSDSRKLQSEIIDLWDTCNVSLVHRTCFFLLFIQAEPADTIYMEVERRRLSFIKDAFSWGNSIFLNGRKLAPGSSKKSIQYEKEKLGKLMKKRFSNQERIDLYLKWGIRLDTKKRSSQLSHRLWINTEDTNHIQDSANVVARLVRFSEHQVPKEVFGLNLMTSETETTSFTC